MRSPSASGAARSRTWPSTLTASASLASRGPDRRGRIGAGCALLQLQSRLVGQLHGQLGHRRPCYFRSERLTKTVLAAAAIAAASGATLSTQAAGGSPGACSADATRFVPR